LEAILESALLAKPDVSVNSCTIVFDYENSTDCSNPERSRAIQIAVRFSEVKEVSTGRVREQYSIVRFELTNETLQKYSIRNTEFDSEKYAQMSSIDRVVAVSDLFQSDGVFSGQRHYTCDGREYFGSFYRSNVGIIVTEGYSQKVFDLMKRVNRRCMQNN